MMDCVSQRRFVRRFYVATAIYVAISILSATLLSCRLVGGPLAIAVALAPAPAACYTMFAFFGVFRTLDELVRKIYVDALMFSWAGVFLLSLTYFLLRNAVDVPYLSGWEIWCAQSVLLTLGIAFGRRRYR